MLCASLGKMNAILQIIRLLASSPVAGPAPGSLQKLNPRLVPHPLLFSRWYLLPRWLHSSEILSAALFENEARRPFQWFNLFLPYDKTNSSLLL